MRIKNVDIAIQSNKWGNLSCRIFKHKKNGIIYDYKQGNFDGYVENVDIKLYIPKKKRSEYIKILKIN